MESRVDTRTLRHIFERGDTIVLHLSWDGDKKKKKKRYRVRHLETARACMDNPRGLVRKGLGRPRRALLYAIKKKNNGHRHVLGEYVEPATLSGGGEWTKWTKADDNKHITSNYEVVKVNGNGDCMFAAVALANEFIFLTTRDIKERVEWYSKDGDDLQKATDMLRSLANSAVCDKHGNIKGIYQNIKDVGWHNGNGHIYSSDIEYCKRLGTSAKKARDDEGWPEGAVFGTHIELDALSRIIDRPIHVYKQQGGNTPQDMIIFTHFPSQLTDDYGDTVDMRVKEPVRIVFHAKHYDAMVRKEDSARASVDEKKQCNICTLINEANATQCTLCHHVFGDT